MSRGGEFKFDLIYSGGSLSQTRHYYLNNQQAVEERLNTGTAADRQNVWGLAYVDQLVLRDRDTDANGSLDERLYACQDANFNLTSVMSTAGAALERYTYTPYGARSIFDASWGARSSSSYSWDVGHQGLFHDGETGLIYNRARFLHPNLGRFMQRDPLGYVDGRNVYEYIRSNPINLADPSGLMRYTKEQCTDLINKMIEQMQHIAEEFLKFNPMTDAVGGQPYRKGTTWRNHAKWAQS